MLIRKRNVSFLCDVFPIVKKKYLDQSSLSLKRGVYSANDLGVFGHLVMSESSKEEEEAVDQNTR